MALLLIVKKSIKQQIAVYRQSPAVNTVKSSITACLVLVVKMFALCVLFFTLIGQVCIPDIGTMQVCCVSGSFLSCEGACTLRPRLLTSYGQACTSIPDTPLHNLHNCSSNNVLSEHIRDL